MTDAAKLCAAVQQIAVTLDHMTSSSTAPRAVSVREFADMNGVSESTVRRLIATGEIASYRIGGQRRIRADEIERIQHND